MGWFDEQLRQRRENDDRAFAASLLGLSDAVTNRNEASAFSGSAARTRSALLEILKYYGLSSQEVPENIQDLEGQMEYLLRPNGIMRRSVTLEKGWYPGRNRPLPLHPKEGWGGGCHDSGENRGIPLYRSRYRSDYPDEPQACRRI